jgi:hypothetical protein
LLLCEEVSDPKTININQYLSTTKFSENNRHCVIKSSQETQLYITKVLSDGVVLDLVLIV